MHWISRMRHFAPRNSYIQRLWLKITLYACLLRLHAVKAETGTCSADSSDTCSGELHRGKMVLGYVTPWNGRGYDVAKQHKDKFTHISPIWYQLRVQEGAPYLTGGHDVDAEWMGALRASADDVETVPRIVPRVMVEMQQPQAFVDMLTGLKTAVIRLLAQECKHSKLDGMVLEVWATWHALGLLQQNFPLVKSFLQGLSKALHKQDGYNAEPMELILAVPPPLPASEGAPAPFTSSQVRQLEDFIDGFSFMTYDFNAFGTPGPNAPLPWVQANLELLEPARRKMEKVLVGLNFYGRDFSSSGLKDVLGHDYTAALERDGAVLHWDEAYQEHKLTYNERGQTHQMFYPSTRSLQVRVEVAQNYGAGLSIWELGQGLDEFLDVIGTDGVDTSVS